MTAEKKQDPPLVFISHASEDKDSFVRPLARAMRKRGIDVWYDEFSLSLGSSLRESIDRGLSRCRYAIVVLSPAFFAKQWTQWELNGLVQRHLSDARKDMIIPIWLNVDSATVARWSPSLADIIAYRAERGVGQLVDFIVDTCTPLPPARPRDRREAFADILFQLRLSISATASIDKDLVHCSIYSLNQSPDGNNLVRVASTRAEVEPPRRFKSGTGITAFVINQRRLISLDNLGDWSLRSQPQMHAMIVAPIKELESDSNCLLGMISVDFGCVMTAWKDNVKGAILALVESSARISAYALGPRKKE